MYLLFQRPPPRPLFFAQSVFHGLWGLRSQAKPLSLHFLQAHHSLTSVTPTSAPKLRTQASRHNIVARGWLGQAGHPVLELRTVNLSTDGVQVRHEAAPHPAKSRPTLRLSLLLDDKVQLLDISVVVRESVFSKGAYLTQLDFPAVDAATRTIIEQVVRGRPVSGTS
jgi:hypothetical protein